MNSGRLDTILGVMAKHAGGRPTKYNEEFHPPWAEALARNGLNDEEIAKKLNISVATLYNWRTDHKEFLEAIRKGKNDPDDQVERAFFKKAIGFREPAVKIFNNNGTPLIVPYEEYYPPDTAAGFIWMKNRRPDKWKDRQEINLKDESPKTIILKRING